MKVALPKLCQGHMAILSEANGAMVNELSKPKVVSMLLALWWLVIFIGWFIQ